MSLANMSLKGLCSLSFPTTFLPWKVSREELFLGNRAEGQNNFRREPVLAEDAIWKESLKDICVVTILG